MDDISVGFGSAKAQRDTAETCATCGRPLTQCGANGECLRCLVSLTFLGDGEEPERPAARGRLTPGPVRYAHFEVETGADGFPVELGAGAMAITYRARDTVCLLYTSDAADERSSVDLGGRRIIKKK